MKKEITYTCKYHSLLGEVLLASDGVNLIGLWFINQKYYANHLEEHIEKNDLPIFKETIKWLDSYGSGQNPPVQLKIKFNGTNFQQLVWKKLLEIPYGTTITYKELSIKIAKELKRTSMSSQAVGGAVSHNPISIIIPCHRVIGTNGNLTGYAGGLDKKATLLELEGITISM